MDNFDPHRSKTPERISTKLKMDLHASLLDSANRPKIRNLCVVIIIIIIIAMAMFMVLSS